MFNFRKLVAALLTFGALAMPTSASAALDHEKLKVTAYAGVDLSGWNHWYGGVSDFPHWEDTEQWHSIGVGMAVKVDGSKLSLLYFGFGGMEGKCGEQCFVQIQSFGNKINGATLDQASIDFGLSNKLSFDAVPYSATPSWLVADKTGLWINFYEGFPPNNEVTLTLSTVPEPKAYALLLAGLGLVSVVARRRKLV